MLSCQRWPIWRRLVYVYFNSPVDEIRLVLKDYSSMVNEVDIYDIYECALMLF